MVSLDLASSPRAALQLSFFPFTPEGFPTPVKSFVCSASPGVSWSRIWSLLAGLDATIEKIYPSSSAFTDSVKPAAGTELSGSCTVFFTLTPVTHLQIAGVFTYEKTEVPLSFTARACATLTSLPESSYPTIPFETCFQTKAEPRLML